MIRATLKTMAAAACFAALVAAAPSPAPPPTDPSHVIKTPVRPPVAPAAARPKPVALAHPGDSAWRRAYVARTGHQPPAAKPRPVPHAAAAHPAAHHPVPAKHGIHRYRRCT